MEEKLLEEWQERLGLQDWNIVINYNYDYLDDGVIGNTKYSENEKEALIRIISKEKYYEEYGISEYDFERILVHELLHCKFAFMDLMNDKYESKVLEVTRHQLLDDLARALVMAKRGEVKRKLSKDYIKVQDMKNKQIKEGD